MKAAYALGALILIVGLIVTNKARDPGSANLGMLAAIIGLVVILVTLGVWFVEWV